MTTGCRTDSESPTRNSIAPIHLVEAVRPTARYLYGEPELSTKPHKDASRTVEPEGILVHQTSYVSSREIDLDDIFESQRSAAEFVSVRSSFTFQGNFYGQCSVNLMRRIQDQFDFNLGNMRWLHSVLQSSTLPLDIPLLERDITEELAAQLEPELIGALLGNVLGNANSSMVSILFQTFSYDQKPLLGRSQSQDSDVVTGHYGSSRNLPTLSTDNMSVPDRPDFRSRSPQCHPRQFYQKDQCNRVIRENYFYPEGSRVHISSSSFSAIDDKREMQRLALIDHRHRKTFQTFDFRSQSRSPPTLQGQPRSRKSSKSSLRLSPSASSSSNASPEAPHLDDDDEEEDMFSLLKRLNESQEGPKMLHSQADVNTSTMVPFRPSSPDQRLPIVESTCPEVRPSNFVSSVVPTSSCYAEFDNSTLDLSNRSLPLPTMLFSDSAPAASSISPEAVSVGIFDELCSFSALESGIDGPSSISTLSTIETSTSSAAAFNQRLTSLLSQNQIVTGPIPQNSSTGEEIMQSPVLSSDGVLAMNKQKSDSRCQRSRSPPVLEGEPRGRSLSNSSSGLSPSAALSSNATPESPYVDDDDVQEDMFALLKRLNESQEGPKVLQSHADPNTSTMVPFLPSSPDHNLPTAETTYPEIRRPDLISSVVPISSSYTGFNNSTLDLSNASPPLQTMSFSESVPTTSFDSPEVVSAGILDDPCSSYSEVAGNSSISPTSTVETSSAAELNQRLTSLFSQEQEEEEEIAPMPQNNSRDNQIIPFPALSSTDTPAVNKLLYKFKDDVEVEVEWIGSVEESIKRFMPKINNEKFDYVGFFMECHHRISNTFRTDLQYVAKLLDNVLTAADIRDVIFDDPICAIVCESWRCSILVNLKCFTGYGRFPNSSILNALGIAFPEKVSHLRDFARDQGFLGWKLARKQYCNVYGNEKFDTFRGKFWRELNQVFFMRSPSTAYWQKHTGQVVFKNLNKVVKMILGNMDLMFMAGPVCVDVQANLNDDPEEVLIGTHFSLGSASLTLISSMFDVSLLMKFLDDLMLLLGGGSLQRSFYNQVANDFYFDLLLARIDFLTAICRSCGTLDPAVKKLIDGSEECLKVLEYLVADDAFYYNLLGWIFGQRLRTDSDEIKEFFKMWSLSCDRYHRSMNMYLAFCQGSSSASPMSRKSRFVKLILESFSDSRIFIGKVCQSSYACSMVNFVLSDRTSNHPGLWDFSSMFQNQIAIEPYTPFCAQALLGNSGRPLVYENITSITGLALCQVKYEKRVAFIRSMCWDPKGSRLAEIIHQSVIPSQFEAVLDIASRDVLYVPAIEQLMSRSTLGTREWWHVGFWRNLACSAAVMPDLGCSPVVIEPGSRWLTTPEPSIPPVIATSV